jgi:hypothetical protein
MVQDVIAEILSWFVPDVAEYISRRICGDAPRRATLMTSAETKRRKRQARRQAKAKHRANGRR